jgi:2-polyprenyl-3-methyl-5-hydroxy-6-metoxy-1,4-benzoquinol methylase
MTDVQRELPEGAHGLTHCPVCGGANFLPWRNVHDDRYGHPGSFHLAHCKACTHLMTLPRLNESDLPALYGTYYPRKALTSEMVAGQAAQVCVRFARLRRWWMGIDNQGQYLVRPGQRMLDIGCGSGVSLLEAQALGARAFGVEADPNVQKLARELGLQIHQGSIEDNPFPGQAFDLIIMNQVVEHIPEPDKAMRLIAARLSPGGRVVVVLPNRRSLWCLLSGPRWINWHIPYHLHHFDSITFERMARCSGLRVKRMRTITPNLWTLLQIRASRTLMSHGKPSPLWQYKAVNPASAAVQLISFRQWLRRSLTTLAVASFGLVNRLIDLTGRGDCLMVELEREECR